MDQKNQIQLNNYHILNPSHIFYQLSPEELVQQSINRNIATLSDTGALCIRTGEFTGRSPEDKFTVDNQVSHDKVDWNKFNKPFPQEKFDQLLLKVAAYFDGKDVFVQDNFACADDRYKISVRVFAEYPWSAQFAGN